MRIVAARDDVIDSGKRNRHRERIHVKVYGVVVEVFQILAGRPIDVGAALLERAIASVPTFGEIRHSTTEMTEHPGDARESVGDSAEHELTSSKRRVQHETNQRHQPVFGHRLDSNRMSWMYEKHCPKLVRHLPYRPKAFVVQTNAIDVAEQHDAGKMKLSNDTLEFLDRAGGIA